MKFSLKEKLETLKQLNQKVHWSCGELVGSKAPNFRFGFQSEPIDSKIFLGIVNYCTKGRLGFPLEDLELNKDFDFLENVLEDYKDKLVVLFPKIVIKNAKVVSSDLVAVSIRKVEKGIIIKGLFKGLKSC